jgi:NADH-quinone oxidoreductase subunit M
MCTLFLGGTTILGAYYMLKMYQHVMLGETNEEFCRCKFQRRFSLVSIIAVLFFWDVSKTNYRLDYTKFRSILNQINKLTSQIKKMNTLIAIIGLGVLCLLFEII